MDLRIYRTFEWVCIGERIGDPNPPYELVHHDQLQYCRSDGIGGWIPIEVVEEEKPEHPRDANLREFMEEAGNWIKEHIEDYTGAPTP